MVRASSSRLLKAERVKASAHSLFYHQPRNPVVSMLQQKHTGTRFVVLCLVASTAFCLAPESFAIYKKGHKSNKKLVHRESSRSMSADDIIESPLQLGTLRVHGPDSKGIVAAFSQLLYGHGCGIFDSEQSTDRHASLFFQRISFDYSTMHTDRVTIESGVREVCERFGMQSTLNWGDKKKKVAIMVSKYDHCLWEILLRHRAAELDCDIGIIISNHPDLKPVADAFHIPFEVFKITKDTKAEQEQRELDMMINTYQIDLVILARYMQIISETFCKSFEHRVINIHHSFLPAFVGSRPYHRAHERGVKLIGATVSGTS